MELFEVEVFLMAGPTLLDWIASTILLSGTFSARPSADAVPAGTEYYATDTTVRYKSDGSSWAVNSGSGSAGVVTLYTRTLTDAEIKALPSTPIAIAAAPGAGIARMPIYATLNLDWTANYTNIHGASQLIMRSLGDSNPLLAYLDETDQSGVTGLLAPGQDTLALMQPPGLALSTFILAQYGIDPNGILNTAINFTAVNSAGDFTGGNAANTLRINLYCVDVPL
jgi:hypothetical protein